MSKGGQSRASGEDRLIARYFQPLARHPGALNLVDDAAMFTPPSGCDLVLTADAIVGGIHFFLDDPPDAIARKALRVNLSDLAAKGSRPEGFLVTLALPKTTSEKWIAGFARGLRADIAEFGCPLFGGDTVRTSGPPAISITAFGSLPNSTMIQRSGAKAGDRIVVTGTIGDAALGLRLRKTKSAGKRWKLTAAEHKHLLSRYLVPLPRLVLADALRRTASAGMDVSDGLVGDLAKLCRASGVDATVNAAHVPFSAAARRAFAAEPALLETMLTGGDDYEIVATVPPAKLTDLRTASAAAGVAVTEIGEIVAGKGEARFIGPDGKTMRFARASFSHF